ncbi:MAG: SAM-dependent methyltransferase [Methanocalculus sp. MSAO_Arc1]|uniref:class I SAM-dependent methyltransferase n=1 Tax=Methanocalculus TaxID=71151 RepID=UPI000FF39ADC|nr:MULTISPECIES: SAM-dependent methyltransferase [unclassified Methanocalculus]MCP1661849.1 tRNA wybutosine-synthesizing protein 2 [Methanocalculus sp. AMF5]RQD81981.1 MAG: SAM-dependent methyltransferase [Methanocalculus sp. MSAO_Arc1]
MRARILPAGALPELKTLEWVDQTRRPYREGDMVYVPVREEYPCDLHIPNRRRRGRGYQRLGDTIIFHGRRPSASDLFDIHAFEQPSCILFMPSHTGRCRIPACEVISGTPHEVLHRESGFSYRLHPANVMFSQGNRPEKERIGSCVRSSPAHERIADMFAGIGYFTLHAADAGGSVHAMEINPTSYRYLQQNIRENGLSARVHAECGDCRDLLSGTYSRIIMGHFEAEAYLHDALCHSEAGSTLHLHTLDPDPERVAAMVLDHGYDAAITVHKVKKYAPQIWHSVMDVVVE